MKIEVYKKENRLFLQLRGRLILDVCEGFRTIVHPLVTPPDEAMLLGMTHVEYLDSAGLGALVDLKILTNKNRMRLSIVAPSPGVANVLTISKLEEIFEIIGGVDAERIKEEIVIPACRLQQYDTSVVSVTTGQNSTQGSPGASSDASPNGALPNGAATENQTAADAERESIRKAVEEYCRSAVEGLRRGDLEESIRLYQKAIAMDPAYIPARNNLAIVYEKKPAWRQLAIEQWESLLELSRQAKDEKHIERAHKHLAKLRVSS